MSNPMAEANVRIITELKKFMHTVSIDTAQRERYCYSPKSFIRRRVLTFSCVVMMITGALKRSLSIEIQEFFMHFSPAQRCSKQAFCEQRIKLKPAFFHDWNQLLVREFYRQYGQQVKTWKGKVLWAIDGSTLPLPQTETLRQAFGWATNQQKQVYNVTARICLLSDVLNGFVIKGLLHSYFSSEEDACLEVLKELPLADKVLLFDRGYPCYWLLYLFIQKGASFIMRVRKNENAAVMRFLSSAQTDVTTTWYPGYRSQKKLQSMDIHVDRETGIRIRMVKVILPTGDTELLITNLYDCKRYDPESLKEAYRSRWNIETGYGNIKEKYQIGQFSGIRPVCIEQDFAANLFLYNLQILIEKQTEPYVNAVSRKRKHPYRINKNVSIGLLKYRVIRLFLSDDPGKVLRELEYLFGNYLEPVRTNRIYPRIKKRRHNRKYYTLTNYKRAL